MFQRKRFFLGIVSFCETLCHLSENTTSPGFLLAELVFVFLANRHISSLSVLSILSYIDVLAFDGFSHFLYVFTDVVF